MKEVNTVEQTDTVAAIATPNAAGGIGIVRISGGDAIAVADKVFSAVSGKPLSEAAGYTAHFGTVNLDGNPIDEAIALVFRAPKSYTGEDTVELSCHGGVYIVRRVLRAVLGAGAQPAGPGEFTKRAFLNGRIDLAKAESVMSLISAQGEQAASAAFNTLEGRLSGRIEEVAHSIINVCAHLSAWVDYPDEDIEELSTDELEKTFTSAKLELEALIRGFENGRAITQGVDTVIVGRPNVGKSTLMNVISGSYEADSGKIFLDGKNITHLKEHQRARTIGRLFQDPLRGTAPNMTIEENLGLAYSRGKRRSLTIGIRKKDVSVFRERLKELDLGLEDRMKMPVGLLSGGQRQALTLLMATIVTPKLLLLDEHTAALDPKTAEKVMKITDKIVKENALTTLMITHNISNAIEYGNKTIVMSQGKLLLTIEGEQRANMTVEKLMKLYSDTADDALSDKMILQE